MIKLWRYNFQPDACVKLSALKKVLHSEDRQRLYKKRGRKIKTEPVVVKTEPIEYQEKPPTAAATTGAKKRGRKPKSATIPTGGSDDSDDEPISRLVIETASAEAPNCSEVQPKLSDPSSPSSFRFSSDDGSTEISQPVNIKREKLSPTIAENPKPSKRRKIDKDPVKVKTPAAKEKLVKTKAKTPDQSSGAVAKEASTYGSAPDRSAEGVSSVLEPLIISQITGDGDKRKESKSEKPGKEREKKAKKIKPKTGTDLPQNSVVEDVSTRKGTDNQREQPTDNATPVPMEVDVLSLLNQNVSEEIESCPSLPVDTSLQPKSVPSVEKESMSEPSVPERLGEVVGSKSDSMKSVLSPSTSDTQKMDSGDSIPVAESRDGMKVSSTSGEGGEEKNVSQISTNSECEKTEEMGAPSTDTTVEDSKLKVGKKSDELPKPDNHEFESMEPVQNQDASKSDSSLHKENLSHLNVKDTPAENSSVQTAADKPPEEVPKTPLKFTSTADKSSVTSETSTTDSSLSRSHLIPCLQTNMPNLLQTSKACQVVLVDCIKYRNYKQQLRKWPQQDIKSEKPNVEETIKGGSPSREKVRSHDIKSDDSTHSKPSAHSSEMATDISKKLEDERRARKKKRKLEKERGGGEAEKERPLSPSNSVISQSNSTSNSAQQSDPSTNQQVSLAVILTLSSSSSV